MNKSLIFFFSFLLTLRVISSCQKEELSNEIPVSSETTTRSKQAFTTNTGAPKPIVLGKKRDNPFTVRNINRAARELYGKYAQRYQATHKYIKFIPNSQEDLTIIDAWSMEVMIPAFDFPLEYEIAEDGDYYVDPEVRVPSLTYQYATIPVGTRMPKVEYKVIDNIYLEFGDPLLLAQSFVNTGNRKDILPYLLDGEGIKDPRTLTLGGGPMKLIPEEIECPPGCTAVLMIDDSEPPVSFYWECDCSDPPPPPPTPTNACGCPIPSNTKKPAGCVRTANDLGGFDGVIMARVKLKDTWFTSDIQFTDVNGCWSHDETYKKKMWIQVFFENGNLKVRDTGYWAGILILRNNKMKINNPPYNNINISFDPTNTRREWAASHTLNTDFNYRNSAAADGIPAPRTGMNVHIHSGSGGAAAPMLQGNPFNSWVGLLAIFLVPLSGLTTFLQPDVVMQYGGTTANGYNAVLNHEYGHTSHYENVGEGYWFGYRNHIVANNGYGTFPNFNGNNTGKVALGEAIGNFMGNRYGNTVAGGENSEWEDGFIPRGLMFDLGDTNADTVTDPNDSTISGTDNISGFTPAMIFNSLDTDINTVRKFRDELRTLHLADTPNSAATYNTFVDIYDVFN